MDEEKPQTSRVPETPFVGFGPYVLDLRSAELRKNDFRIRLQEQPFQILVALLERPGEVVLREEIRQKLWPDETVVEFDHSINAAVKRLRDALLDSAEKPRYVETLARRGYRFIGQVKAVSIPLAQPSMDENAPSFGVAAVFAMQYPSVAEPEPPIVSHLPTPQRSAAGRDKRLILTAAVVTLLIAGGAAITLRPRPTVHDAEMTRLTFDSGLTTEPAVSPDGKLIAYASDRHGSGRLHIWAQQFIPDGQAVQLTRGDADDHQPTFSPDGSTLAFRSERDGGGIYTIPAIGGEATLIAKGGRDPRFSPDGRWIAYWQADMMAAPFAANAGTVYLVPSAGGLAQPLRSNLTDAGVPQWSEDGSRLIVYGRSNDLVGPVGDWNWWVVPFKGGPATNTGAFGVLRAKGFTIGPQAPRIANWKRNELLFSARLGDSVNVWKIHLDGSGSQVTGDPQRITFGTGLDAYPSLSADGRLLFATLASSADVWILPVDTNGAKPIGEPRRITDTVGPHHFASLSMDGKLLAYSSLRYGRPRAWIKNLESGTETPMTSGTASEDMPQLSPDGSLLAYASGGENGTGFVVPVRGGPADPFCTNCASTYDLSPDNRVVLYRKGDSIRAFNLVSRRESLFMRSANFHVYQHKLSVDGRWVTFEGLHHHRLSQIYVAAMQNGEIPAPDSEWITVTSDEGWADKPRWSPDGNVVYFISNRDGFFCLWAQRVAAGSKRPVGAPLAMAHFHGSRVSIDNIGPGGPMEISVARDKIAFNLGELTGNLWVTSVSR